MGRDEKSPEAPEPAKIGQTIFVQFVGQAIEICNAIFHDPDSLGGSGTCGFWVVQIRMVHVNSRQFGRAKHMCSDRIKEAI